MSVEERELDQVEADIKALQVDFRRFFAGDLALPPLEGVERLGAKFRRFHTASIKSAVLRFRVQQLEARYNSYRELFGRQLRDLEEGRTQRGPGGGGTGPSAPDPHDGIVLGDGPRGEGVEALFGGLHKGGQSKLDLETFRTYIDRQVDLIRQKTGCRDVQFRLTTEDGKVKLKAKALRD